MSKLNAVHLLFKGPKPNIPGKWEIHPLPFESGTSGALVTFSAGVPGTWEAHPAPFIVTPDPNPRQVLTAVYDSTTVQGIGRLSSTSPEAVAAYDDGAFNNLAEAQKLYPNHEVLSIAVFKGHRALYGDSETGDMSSEESLQDCADGFIRGIYANLDRWNRELIPLLHGKFSHIHPLKWVADWTGVPHLPRLVDGSLADACQYSNHALHKVNTDVSLFTQKGLGH